MVPLQKYLEEEPIVLIDYTKGMRERVMKDYSYQKKSGSGRQIEIYSDY